MRFGENNVLCPKYIDIYEFVGVRGRRTYYIVHFFFIIKKNEKVLEHDQYLNQILHHFHLKKIRRLNNKKITKRGPHKYPSPISLRSECSRSN